MPSSIFGSGQGGNSILAAVNRLRSIGDPQAMYGQMYQNDPQFRKFADSVKGKTPDQAFRENGLDFDKVRRMIR